MKKLTIEYLAPYLPYELKMRLHGNYPIKEGIDNWITDFQTLDIKRIDRALTDKNFNPILRPLSNLTKEIEVNGEKFVPIRKLKTGGTDKETVYTIEDWDGINYVCSDNESHELRFSAKSGFDRRYNCESRQIYAYDMFKKLFEWHFDVFGLIESGLAIDINELNN